MSVVILSDLAVDQLSNLGSRHGRVLLENLDRLRSFPQSAPIIEAEGYEGFRQLIILQHRIIYKFDEAENLVRVYTILSVRRQLPDAEFLQFQLF